MAITRNKVLTEEEAFQKLAQTCARSEHCTGEMIDKLRKWGFSTEQQNRIIDQLTDQRYIDDERFTACFVQDKIEYNGWGRRKIEQALYQKRVSKSISTPILDAVEEETYLNILQPLLQQKLKTTKAASEYERAQKLIRFSMGRGFSFDQTMKVLKRLIDDAPDDIEFEDEQDD